MNDELMIDQNSEVSKIGEEELDVLSIPKEENEAPVQIEATASDVTIDEGFVVSGLGAEFNHALLLNRDQPDQHTIDSITGLRGELNKIIALGPVYSDQVNHAEYFLWKDRNIDKEFRDGLFVTLCDDIGQIDVCSGLNIFGVTVKNAAVIGNQTEIARDYSYSLVVRNGLVNVRCENDVKVGDYVIPNSYGIAKRTDDICGCTVASLNNINGILYATISLSDTMESMHVLSCDIERLDDRVDEAETNIVSAINVANAAHELASDMSRLSEEIDNKVQDAINKAESAVQTTEGFYNTIQDASKVAEEARAIAQSATTYSESIKNEAIANANDAWAKADNVSKEFMSLVATIDIHSVGEYSQAYNLTMEQAASILQFGMIYVPTKHADINSHSETYLYEDGRKEIYEFTPGYYYTWDGSIWKESASPSVCFTSECPTPTDKYIYWYTGNDVFDNRYERQTLYLYKDGDWMAVATLSGNSLNRTVSLIHQESNRIALEVTNAQKDIAALDVRLDEEGAKIGMVVSTDNKVNAHVIAQAINDDSSVSIKADRIAMTGTATFLTSEDLGKTGSTVIDGGRIDATNLHVDAANIDGTLTVLNGKGKTLLSAGNNAVSIAGWSVDSNSLYYGDSFNTATAFLCTGSTGDMTIAGHTGTNWVLKAGEHFGVNTNGELYCNAGTFGGKLSANTGDIGGFDISTDGLYKTTELMNTTSLLRQDVVNITPSNIVVARELYTKNGDELELTGQQKTSLIGGKIYVSLLNDTSFFTVEQDGTTYNLYIDPDTMTVKVST